MSEPVMRAESAPHPIDLATLSRPARSLLKRLTAYPSWLEEGWAHPSDEHLRDVAEYRDKRPIRRARQALVARGLVEHRQIRRGEFLPNGERARFRHWIYVMGPALRPSPPTEADGGGELVSRPAEAPCEKGPGSGVFSLPDGAFLVPRSVDLERSERVRSSVASEQPSPAVHPPPNLNLDKPTSLRSLGSTSDETPPENEIPQSSPPPLAAPVRAPEVATTVLASEVARYFVAATGLGWKTIRNDILEYLRPFLDGMNDDEPGTKVARACRVIDAAVLESGASGARKPTLRYVFHREMFWKRLAALGDPAARPLAKAARRPVEASAPPKAAVAAPDAPRAPRPKPAALPLPADSETTLRALAAILALGGGAPIPERHDVGRGGEAADEELAELAELARADNEARARRGLPPRYPPARSAA